ncbi:ABC transporter, ATP-binding protein, partial [human gut metagenome]
YFLDSVCNGILELSNRRMYQYDGNYEEFIALKADREARGAATAENSRPIFDGRHLLQKGGE